MYLKRFISLLLIATCLIPLTLLPASAQGYDKTNIASDIEWEMLDLINKLRIENGLTPFTTTPAYMLAASMRAQEMSESGESKATRPNSKPWYQILYVVGMDSNGNEVETRASGSASAEKLLNALMSRDDHKSRILSTEYDHIGIGHDNSGKLKNAWSIIFIDCNDMKELSFTQPGDGMLHTSASTTPDSWDLVLMAKCDDHGKSYVPLLNGMVTAFDPNKIGVQKLSAKLGSLTATTDVYNDFGDVVKDSWYYQSVVKAFDTSLFSGVGDGKFEPDSSMTRAMFVVVLSKVAGVDTSKFGESGYTDVPADTWYTKAVTWASQYGIVGGTGNGKFDPDKPVTRQEICVMLKAYADKTGTSTTVINSERKFADDASIASWAKDAVKFCQTRGFIAGDSQNNFNPVSSATRAQVAVIAVNFKKAIGK